MTHRLSDDWFRTVRSKAVDVRSLQLHAREVLARRPLPSFDGFGHLLDEVLPEDERQVERIALTIRLPLSTISRLRASRLDPLSVPSDPLVLLAYILGLGWEDVEALVLRDHGRFADQVDNVFERGESESIDDRIQALRESWSRILADDATDL